MSFVFVLTSKNNDQEKVTAYAEISNDAFSILSKGPKFMLSNKLDSKNIELIKTPLLALVYQTGWAHFHSTRNTETGKGKTSFSSLLSKCSFDRQRRAPPLADDVTELELKRITEQVINVIKQETSRSTARPNTSSCER